MPSNSSPTDLAIKSHRLLFEVRIRHHYFLDAGVSRFNDPDAGPAVQALRPRYDVQQFWRIEPSAFTRQQLAKYQLLFQRTREGFRVLAVVDERPISPEEAPDKLASIWVAEPAHDEEPTRYRLLEPHQLPTFTFLIQQTDPDFWLYTPIIDSTAFPPAEAPTADSAFMLYASDFDAETSIPAVEPGKLCESMPFKRRSFLQSDAAGLLEISSPLLTGERYLQNLTLSLRLPNRATSWVYRGSQAAYYGYTFTDKQFPLTRYGIVDLSDYDPLSVPNPSVSTTVLTVDENENKQYVSYIY